VSITVTKYSPIECVIKTVAEASVALFSIDSATVAVTSSVLPAEMLPTIRAQALVLRDLVGPADFAAVLPGALPRLLTASPLGSLDALTLAVGTVGTVSTLTVSGLSSPDWFIAAAAYSATGGFNTDRGTFTTGGPAVDGGVVDAPPGSGPFAAGTPVVISGGVALACDAGIANFMPAVGIWTSDGRIRTDGLITGLAGLTANVPYYVAVGGGLTDTAPEAPNTVQQRVGTSVGANSLFVSIRNEVYNEA
jgi:hypothetical protein